MTAHNRNDTPVEASRPEWLALVEQAAKRQTCRGLPKPPPGIEYQHRAYYATTRSERRDGSVRVYVKWCAPGSTVVLGSYAVSADGNGYPVGKIMTRSDGLRVMVTLDADQGLPWPVLVL